MTVINDVATALFENYDNVCLVSFHGNISEYLPIYIRINFHYESRNKIEASK